MAIAGEKWSISTLRTPLIRIIIMLTHTFDLRANGASGARRGSRFVSAVATFPSLNAAGSPLRPWLRST
jgi:hypothetical protein